MPPLSTPRKPRASLKGDIPHNYILKWQSAGPKPLVRRPMTACQTCRTAKVKCDGQQECDRCTSRGIVCRYTNTETLDTSPTSDPPSSTDVASPLALTQSTPEEISMDLDTTDATNRFSMDSTAYNDAFDGMGDWAPDIHQPLDDFDWETLDVNLKEHAFDSLTTPPIPPELDVFQPLPNPPTQSLTSATPLFEANFGGTTTMAPTNTLSQSSQLFSLPKCRCRESLAVLVPRVNNAMQKKQLDEVFKGTQKVVEGFQDIVDCTGCKITCVDLICIMAVFQQTDTCFEYIARADLGSAINMSFGGYEVPINDPKLRAMLVMSLIHQATAVLDAISSKGQHMIRTLCTPSPLAQANISYLDTVIRDFRNVLRKVFETADRAGSSQKNH